MIRGRAVGRAGAAVAGVAIAGALLAVVPAAPALASGSGAISGTLTDGAGNGVAGVCVSAQTDGYPFQSGGAVTDATGGYRISGLSSGNFRVNFGCWGGDWVRTWYDGQDDWQFANVVPVTDGAETTGISSRLVLGGTITGTVTDDTGAPLSGAYISAAPASGPGFANGTTDSSGTYRIRGVRPGAYKVSVFGTGQHWWHGDDEQSAESVIVASGHTASGIDIVAPRTGSISGTVTDSAGNPLPSVCVFPQRSTDPTDYMGGQTSTSSTGEYRLTGLDPASYRLGFHDCSSNSSHAPQFYGGSPSATGAAVISISVGSNVTGVNVQLADGGRISGTVTKAADGAPVTACVSARPPAGEPWYAYATGDDTGHYVIDGLATEPQTVTAFACSDPTLLGRTYHDQPIGPPGDPVSVTAGQETTGIDQALPTAGSITGTVVDASGQPYAGACVYATQGQFASWYGSTDSSGSYTISGLDTGSYTVEFSPCSFTSPLAPQWWHGATSAHDADPVAVTAGATTAQIDGTLVPAASLAGTVVDTAGRPVRGACIAVYKDASSPSAGQGFTGDDGRFSVKQLPAGTYHVLFYDCWRADRFASTWFDGAADQASSTPVTLAAGEARTDVNAHVDDVAPRVDGLTPTAGPDGGGTVVAIVGAGLAHTNAVKFGSTPATSFTVVSANEVDAIAPPGAAGTSVDVTATGPGGTSATSAADRFTYRPGPHVSGVAPAVGATSGGTPVVISGTGLAGATTVSFGSANATFSVVSDTEIDAVSPPGGSGPVDVAVSTSAGTSPATSSDRFTYVQSPSISAVSPDRGGEAGGTPVTISGQGFTATSSVSFGSGAAASFTVVSDTEIDAMSPAASAPGAVDVRVTNPAGTSSASADDQFTYVPAPPTITALSTHDGPAAGGTAVTLTGTDLGTTTAVRFGTTAASFTVVDDRHVAAVAPPATGRVHVIVDTLGGTSSATDADAFTYHTAPAVAALTPTQGPTAGGTAVTITGSGLAPATAVAFGTRPAASFTVVSDTEIDAVAPPAAAGPVDVAVTTPWGTSSSGPGSRYLYVAPPAVSSITPSVGGESGGTSVTLTGSNLAHATRVRFGTAAATFTVVDDQHLNALAPAGTGSVHITVDSAGGTSPATSADLFTYKSAPNVTGVYPAAGSTNGGTAVTITGHGFNEATGVAFGGMSAAFTIVSKSEIRATAPPGVAGTVDVTVSSVFGSSARKPADHFTYVDPPSVTAISPSSGPVTGGTAVTISGRGFAGATAVSFGSTAAASFTVVSDTQVVASTPALPSGIVDVTVTTAYGTSAAGPADRFRAIGPPSVARVAPNQGSFLGGTAVTISGIDLDGATSVLFGSQPAASFVANPDGTITAIAPRALPGTVDITVTTAFGTSLVTAADRFTYTLLG